jgi:DNA topoisomerase IA
MLSLEYQNNSQTKPIQTVKELLNQLEKVIVRDDIDLLINECDAGREGESIFPHIQELGKCKNHLSACDHLP